MPGHHRGLDACRAVTARVSPGHSGPAGREQRCLTRAGRRRIEWPHEIPDSGISHRNAGSGPCSGTEAGDISPVFAALEHAAGDLTTLGKDPLHGGSSPPSDTQSGGTSPFSEHRLNTRTARLMPAASPGADRSRLPPREAAVTGTLIAPVIPSSAAARPARAPAAARTLPLTVPPVRPPALPRDVVYGLAHVDRSGRVADRTVTGALGWRGGDRLTLTAEAGVVVIRRDPAGLVTLPPLPRRTADRPGRCARTAALRLRRSARRQWPVRVPQPRRRPPPVQQLRAARLPPGVRRAAPASERHAKQAGRRGRRRIAGRPGRIVASSGTRDALRSPSGRGSPRLISTENSGRCQACGYAVRLRLDGRTIAHKKAVGDCPGSGGRPQATCRWPAGCRSRTG